jgi:hypothetical protein
MIIIKMPKEAKHMFTCSHAVEIGDSKKHKGQSLWNIFNGRWQKVWPKAIYADCELRALMKCREMINLKLASLMKSKKQKEVDFK